MELNVDLDNLKRLLGHELAPALAEGGEHHDLLLRLAHEILLYGADVLPREIYERTSGREIAAMACEDLEGALRILPLLEPTLVTPPAPPIDPAAEGEEPEAPQPVEVFPRVVHLSDGWGFPSLVLARLRPAQTIEVVETSARREWFWNRALRVFSIRNLRVHTVDSLEAWCAANGGSVDVLLTKRLDPRPALDLGLPLLKPGGRLIAWQRSDRLRELRRPIFDPRGQRIEVDESYAFASAVAQPRTLLCVGCSDEEAHTAPASAHSA